MRPLQTALTVSSILPDLERYMRAERGFSAKTIGGYKEAIRFFVKVMGDPAIEDLRLGDFVSFKARMAERRAGQSRVAGIIHAMKCLLGCARDVYELHVMDISAIKAPKPTRKAVVYLSPKEVGTFIAAIPTKTTYGRPRLAGYCFRALVEALLATGMRISEALRLNRGDVNLVAREALVTGKRGKQRTVYFTQEAMRWLGEYLKLRQDSEPALFASREGSRLAQDSVGAMFRRIRAWSGLEKLVTPHMLRHTAATTLLRNGCPIGFIREILGHEDLQTTCRYYLGRLEHDQVRQAHERYMSLAAHDSPLPEAPRPES